MGSGGKKQTVGYKYLLDVQHVLCHGPVESLEQILVDDRELERKEDADNGDALYYEDLGLFGGESREGGISANVWFETGAPDQEPNVYLQSQLGNDIPAYRGVASVLTSGYMGTNPYLKPWSFRPKRIHITGAEGVLQWYDEKAEVLSPLVRAQQEADIEAAAEARAAADEWIAGFDDNWNNSFEYSVYDENGAVVTAWTNAPQPYGSASFATYVESHDYWEIWQRRNIVIPAFAPGYQVTLNMHFISDDGGQATWDGFGIPHTAYVDSGRRQHPLSLGPDVTLVGEHIFQTKIKNSKADDFVTDYGSDSNIYSKVNFVSLEAIAPPLPTYTGDMNPAHIIREAITDSVWGMGYSVVDVDDDSFMSAADTLYDECMGISMVWSQQTAIEDFIAEILRHIDGALYVDRKTGKFVLTLIRDDYEIETLLTLNESNISSVTDYARPAPGELTNSVTINFTDSETWDGVSLSLQDTAAIQQQGHVQDVALDFRGFSNPGIIARVLARELNQRSRSLVSCTVIATNIAENLNPGDPFILDWPAISNIPIVVRALDVALGGGKSKEVRLTVTQDAFSLPLAAAVAGQVTQWLDPSVDPVAADYRILVESPYWELVQRYGQTATDALLQDNPEAGYMQASAARPAGAINAQLIVSTNNYNIADSVSMDFCPTATLVDSVGHLDTVWTIQNGIDLDLVGTGTHAQINNELIRIDAISLDAGTLTVGRGVLDTVPALHSTGDRIFFWDAYAESDEVEYADGETLGAIVLPATGKGVLDKEGIIPLAVTFDQRAIRPYPPADVQISGAYYPAILTGSINITWVGRDRIQQTSGTLYDYFDANIGPEAGVTYNGYVYDDDTDALLYSATGIVSPWSVPVAGDANVRIELESERDGITSFQRFSHVALLANGYGGATRITEDADTRITQSGDTRITED